MGATLKVILYVIIGLLIGLFAYQGCDRALDNAGYLQQIAELKAEIEKANARKCDTIRDTAWKERRIYVRPQISNDVATTDTALPCLLHWYQDTVPFDDIDMYYSLSTLGTLEDMSFGYRLKVPKIVNVPVPCPDPDPVCPPPVPSKWSATVMVGYPSAAYVGVGYRIAPKLDVLGGVHTLLNDPARGSAMVGLRIGL